MVEREEKRWGVRLVMKPLSGRPEMRIIGEVNSPKGERNPETRFWFDGVPGDGPLRMTELMVWRQGLQKFVDLVKGESAAMKAKAAKKK